MTATENKDFVQNIMEARSRRDPAPFIAAMADDFVWRIIGSTAWSGEYVGKADVRERLLKPLYAQFTAPSSITPTRILWTPHWSSASCDRQTACKRRGTAPRAASHGLRSDGRLRAHASI